MKGILCGNGQSQFGFTANRNHDNTIFSHVIPNSKYITLHATLKNSILTHNMKYYRFQSSLQWGLTSSS
jgi:hypothetical protein